MRAIIVGSSLSGIIKAAELRKSGADVIMLASGSYLMEDVTEIWGSYPLSRQDELKNRLNSIADRFGLEAVNDAVLTPSAAKRLAVCWMRELGVCVRYLTSFVGVSLSGGKISGVIACDQRGIFHLPCEFAYDAALYMGAASSLLGDPVTFKKGAKAIFRYELTDTGLTQDTASLLIGSMAQGHVFVEKNYLLECDMTYAQLRRKYIDFVIDEFKHVDRGDPVFENALPGSALPLSIEVDEYFVPDISIDGWNEGVGSCAEPEEMLVYGKKLPWMEENGRPLIDIDAFEAKTSDVCVVGMGTAGVWAAMSAKLSGASVIGVEMLPYMGGTRTLGGVVGRYYGNRSPLFFKMVGWISEFSKAILPKGYDTTSSILGEMLYYSTELSGIEFMARSIVCGVKVVDGRVVSVLCAGEDGIKAVRAKQFIDAAGDGGLSALCGCGFDVGDDNMHVMQNYSQWNRCAFGASGVKSVDQDTMDDTEGSEWTRAIENNIINADRYDLFDMLTVRESRRMHGRIKLTMRDIARGRRYKDALCETYSTYDPHGRCMDMIGRLGLMPALGKARFVSVPLGAVTFDTVENLMIAGKAISCDQNAFNFIRMSADVAALAWAEGRISAACAKTGVMPEKLPLEEVQKEMFDLGALTYMPSADENTVSPLKLAAGIINENQSALHEAMLCEYDEVKQLILSSIDAGARPRNMSAKYLAYTGDTTWAKQLDDRLGMLVEKNGAIIYSDNQNHDGVARCGIVDDRLDEYWDMNQIAVLLSKAGYEPGKENIKRMMELTVPGGDWINTASDYAHIRLDCQTIPNFDRIFSLCGCALLMPCGEYAEPLKKLDEELSKTKVFGSSFYKEMLWVNLARARLICGDETAGLRKEELSGSKYFVIRENAKAI